MGVNAVITRGVQILDDCTVYSGARYFHNNYCIPPIAYPRKKVYHFTCIEQKAPDSSAVPQVTPEL